MTAVDLAQRLTELEQRVAALEGAAAAAPDPTDAEDGGTVGYRGHVRLGGGEVHWQIDVSARQVLAVDDRRRIDVLAALAHPVRAGIVRTLVEHGPAQGAALQSSAGLGSTGQLYHHLKALTGAGLVEQDKRGSYRLRATAVVPVLVLLAAASDVAGQLGS
ncbi:ArsR/SmtB family transcription factor [Umezawaea beigongshangensis]|uniref:ArsR/SmtB family transcription factor n=1 Tax=Umezawaea beigongshangensis TaxID=2780383 RepID=UPI0018F1D9A1|nr:helix-turn-helix domain-containing protein [Umezawaea beigongshangensis]